MPNGVPPPPYQQNAGFNSYPYGPPPGDQLFHWVLWSLDGLKWNSEKLRFLCYTSKEPIIRIYKVMSSLYLIQSCVNILFHYSSCSYASTFQRPPNSDCLSSMQRNCSDTYDNKPKLAHSHCSTFTLHIRVNYAKDFIFTNFFNRKSS